MIGPFTLKQFVFVFVAAMVTVIVMVFMTNLGMSMVPSLIIGAFFGSFSLLVCFVPYNGKPIYTFVPSFVSFIIKPRQRVWKKIDEQQQKTSISSGDAPATENIEQLAPQKASLESAESKIEEISLMVDTGGAYGMPRVAKSETNPSTIFDKNSPGIDKSLQEAREKLEVENPSTEPLISDIATVDPKKKFEYASPDTSKYKIDEVVAGGNIEVKRDKEV